MIFDLKYFLLPLFLINLLFLLGPINKMIVNIPIVCKWKIIVAIHVIYMYYRVTLIFDDVLSLNYSHSIFCLRPESNLNEIPIKIYDTSFITRREENIVFFISQSDRKGMHRKRMKKRTKKNSQLLKTPLGNNFSITNVNELFPDAIPNQYKLLLLLLLVQEFDF